MTRDQVSMVNKAIFRLTRILSDMDAVNCIGLADPPKFGTAPQEIRRTLMDMEKKLVEYHQGRGGPRKPGMLS